MPGQWPEDKDGPVVPTRTGTIYNTIARFASSATLEVLNVPYRLMQYFTRPQQYRAIPIVREDGASKRRLVDAGLAPVTPTRRRDPGGRQGQPRQHSRSPDVTHSPTPGLWQETPPTPTYTSPQYTSPQYTEEPQDYDIDDSLDWSMEDVDSGTPPRNLQTGSPTGDSWLRRPERKIISPNSQFAILRRASVTPMRKQLLKKQLRAAESVTTTSPVLREHDHTVASPTPQDLTISDLKKKTLEASVLTINAPSVAANAQEASARYKAELVARENRGAEARAAPEHDYYNNVETVDIDLSYLPDASNINSVVTLHTPSPTPPRRRNVRWASQSNVKSYYVDERISEMLDSTLEAIRSPIPKPNFKKDDDESSEEPHELTFEDPDSASDNDESVDGPALDDSLEESELSKELLQDLEEDFKNLLAQAPPPRPQPKPLIAVLSDSERSQLEDIAAKSKHGRNGAYPIIPNKITARDFGTLLPDQFNGSAKAWLNDEIVNQYLAILVKTWNEDAGFTFKRGGPAPPYHAFSSHWFNSITTGGLKNVERWAARVGLGHKQYLDAKLVLYPICDGSHWRLLAVKPQERVIECLDSLGWDGNKYIRKLREYLQHELKEFYKADEWTVVELQRSSRQLNGSDCGVFVLLNALVLLRGDDIKKVIACNGMLAARERVAVTILTGHPVELDY